VTSPSPKKGNYNPPFTPVIENPEPVYAKVSKRAPQQPAKQRFEMESHAETEETYVK